MKSSERLAHQAAARQLEKRLTPNNFITLQDVDHCCGISFVLLLAVIRLKHLAQHLDRFLEEPIVNRAQQTAPTHRKSLLRNRLFIQRNKISVTKIPDWTKRLIGGGRLRRRKPCDLPIEKKGRPGLPRPQIH